METDTPGQPEIGPKEDEPGRCGKVNRGFKENSGRLLLPAEIGRVLQL